MDQPIDRQAADLYEAGADEELMALASQLWPADLEATLPAGVSEVCRFARLAARRTGNYVQQEVWTARALAAASLTAYQHSTGGLLLSSFFGLVEEGAYDQARAILDEMARLIDDGFQGHPPAAVMRRMYHEKRTYSLLVEGSYADAAQSYSRALEHCEGQDRAELKVRGGLALAHYLGGAVDASLAGEQMQSILDSVRECRTD